MLILHLVTGHVVTSPTGAVTKYCDEHTCDLYQVFVHVAYVRGLVFLHQGDEIPREGAVLGVFFPINSAL